MLHDDTMQDNVLFSSFVTVHYVSLIVKNHVKSAVSNFLEEKFKNFYQEDHLGPISLHVV